MGFYFVLSKCTFVLILRDCTVTCISALGADAGPNQCTSIVSWLCSIRGRPLGNETRGCSQYHNLRHPYNLAWWTSLQQQTKTGWREGCQLLHHNPWNVNRASPKYPPHIGIIEYFVDIGKLLIHLYWESTLGMYEQGYTANFSSSSDMTRN